jgi:hypothetical protein
MQSCSEAELLLRFVTLHHMHRTHLGITSVLWFEQYSQRGFWV